MAKPYRRRKGGKKGPFVGNFRVTVNGRDLNLGTKDANEALARARLAVKGLWPPDEVAAAAAAKNIDPARAVGPAVGALLNLPGAPAPAPPEVDHAVTVAPTSGGEGSPDLSGSAAAASQPDPPAPGPGLDDAAAAAAREAAGTDEEVQATKAEREAEIEGELAGIMGELSGGQGGGQLVDGVCDGVAAAILWAERKGIELGWKWTFQKHTGKRLVAGPQPDPGDLARRCLRVGLKGVAIVHFPELAAKLTPAWAIAIGCIAGAGGAIIGGQLVDVESGESKPFADVAKEAAAAQGSPPPPVAAA